jgi:hypothetical protein
MSLNLSEIASFPCYALKGEHKCVIIGALSLETVFAHLPSVCVNEKHNLYYYSLGLCQRELNLHNIQKEKKRKEIILDLHLISQHIFSAVQIADLGNETKMNSSGPMNTGNVVLQSLLGIQIRKFVSMKLIPNLCFIQMTSKERFQRQKK